MPLFMMVRIRLVATVSIVCAAGASDAVAQEPLIPREAFCPPVRIIDVKISPAGTHVATLARTDQTWRLTLDPLGWGDDMVFDLGDDPVASFRWSMNSERILLERTSDRDRCIIESIDIARGVRDALTPPDQRATILADTRALPDEIAIGLRNAQRGTYDLWRLNTRTTERTLILDNERGFIDFVFDQQLALRLGVLADATGARTVLARSDDGGGGWIQFNRWNRDDARLSRPLGISFDGRAIYFAESSRGDFAELYAYIKSDNGRGEYEMIAQSPGADLDQVWFHPETGRAQVATFAGPDSPRIALDRFIEADFEVLRTVDRGPFTIVSRDLADRLWVVRFESADRPASFYLYRRGERTAALIAETRPALVFHALAPSQRIGVPVRGDAALPCILTVDPQVSSESRVPLVVFVHDGPDGRVDGFLEWQTFLADRGYAVLSVDHHGSSGRGKRFQQAGVGEWAGLIPDELIDAVLWAIDRGIADPDRIAIFGDGLGAFQTMAGLTFTPGFFTAGIAINPPLDLERIAEALDETTTIQRNVLLERSGALSNPRILESISPLHRLESRSDPLLVLELEQHLFFDEDDRGTLIQAARSTKTGPLVAARFGGAGVADATPRERLAVFALIEQFLSAHLKGRAQRVDGALDIESIELTTVDGGS